jgi:hypothetical protein
MDRLEKWQRFVNFLLITLPGWIYAAIVGAGWLLVHLKVIPF